MTISYQIYPAIGIARVGNAPDKFYVGPEVYRGLPTNPDGSPFTSADFRDQKGRLCRQAARFRVYQVQDDGSQTEVTLDTAGVTSISWEVHLANKKPSWYKFQVSLGENGYAINHPLRNAGITGEARKNLMIDPGPRTIAGRSQAALDCGKSNVPNGYPAAFPPPLLTPNLASIDTLGQLQTDSAGRLLILGGLGISGSILAGDSIAEYANNDNWWDDTADGVVTVTVVAGGQTYTSTATVLVGPPSYAPEIANLVSLYDTMYDAVVRSGNYPARYNNLYANGTWNSGPNGYLPNFQTDIAPLLERAMLYPWVAAIPPKPHSFNFDLLGAVDADGKGARAYQGFRQYILDFLRPPEAENEIINNDTDGSATGPAAGRGATMMPFLAGDNALILGHAPSKYLRITDTQYFFMQQWANGWFVNTTPAASTTPGDDITRGVLENCVGGAFSPGIEMTWISRNPAIYTAAEPFRINHAPVQNPLTVSGFFPAAMQPGDVTRYMAVPWQADFNECSSQQPLDGRVLWWWPAQRPEYVYLPPPPADARSVSQPSATSGLQVPWQGTDFDQLAPDYIQFANDAEMVQYWSGLGFVMGQEFDGDTRYVETSRTLPRPYTTFSAPANVSAKAGNGSASVSFDAPVSSGNGELDGYLVQALEDSNIRVEGGPDLTTINVPGLTNGKTYTFVVTAGFAVSDGTSQTVFSSAASSPANPVTPQA
jgi:L-Lysine epsilon oxidase N-terminal/L-lysine epsilon oxidase C-terminal domain/Fibronectin type III domain